MTDADRRGEAGDVHARRVAADRDGVVAGGAVDGDAVGLAVAGGAAEGGGEVEVERC